MFGLGSGGMYAMVITASNRIKIFSVSPIHGRMFLIPDLGMFQLNEKWRYSYKKSEIYIFDKSSCNPINIDAVREIQTYLVKHTRTKLTEYDLPKYVEKYQRVDIEEQVFDKLYTILKEQDGLTDKQITELYERGELDSAIDKMVNTRLRENNSIKVVGNGSGFSDSTIDWLNDYYSEDVMARNYLYGRIFAEDKFRIRHSMGAAAFLKEQFTGKRNIAIIVINNKMLDIDSDIKTEIDEETGLTLIKTRKYGTFRVEETQTRYRYGKANIYFMAVKTPTKKPSILTEKEEVVTTN